VSQNNVTITLGDQKFSHLDALRAILIQGRGKIATDVCSAVLQPSLNQHKIRSLFGKTHDLSKKKAPKYLLMGHANKEIKSWEHITPLENVATGSMVQMWRTK